MWDWEIGMALLRAFEAAVRNESFESWLQREALIRKVPAEGEACSEEEQLIFKGLLPETDDGTQQVVSSRAKFTSSFAPGAGQTHARNVVKAMAALTKQQWKFASKQHTAILPLSVTQAAHAVAHGRVSLAMASLCRFVRVYPLKARLPGNPDHDRVVLKSGMLIDALYAEWRRRVWAAQHSILDFSEPHSLNGESKL